MVRLSPDGTRISYLAPSDGVLNVFVGPLDDPAAAKPVTREKERGVQAYFWAYDKRTRAVRARHRRRRGFSRLQRRPGGRQDRRSHATGRRSRPQIEGVSEKFPREILVGINDRDPQFYDLYRIDVATGERKLVEKNTRFAGYVTDNDLRARFAMQMTPDGGSQLFQADGKGGWRDFQKIDAADTLTTSLTVSTMTNQVVFLTDSRGRNTSALAQIDLASGKETILAANDLADVGETLIHPTEKNLQAAAFNFERLDLAGDRPSDRRRFALSAIGGRRRAANPQPLAGTTSGGSSAYLMDNGPMRYYLYERDKKEAKFLFTNRKSARRPIAGQDEAGRHHLARRAEACQLSHACRSIKIPTAPAARKNRCRWCCWCMAGRGGATLGATSPSINCWPTAAMRC